MSKYLLERTFYFWTITWKDILLLNNYLKRHSTAVFWITIYRHSTYEQLLTDLLPLNDYFEKQMSRRRKHIRIQIFTVSNSFNYGKQSQLCISRSHRAVDLCHSQNDVRNHGKKKSVWPDPSQVTHKTSENSWQTSTNTCNTILLSCKVHTLAYIV